MDLITLAMNQELFESIGLSPEESAVYTTLLSTGPSAARKITTVSGMKRGMVYKALSRLETLNLVEKRDPPSGVAIFYPAHPSALREALAKKQESFLVVKESLEAALGPLTSAYNLASGRPNVRFFEGKKGMEEILDDSLYAKEEIRSYLDVESIMALIPKINELYVSKREKLGIKKRGIIYDTPQNREIAAKYHTNITSSRFIPWKIAPTQSIMQIYDGKVSYLTLTPESMIGIIIEDPHIYATHKALFDSTWGQLPSVNTQAV